MDVIRLDMAFQNLDLLLPDDLPHIPACFAFQNPEPVFQAPNQALYAVPDRM
jgi:hypothetical protein